MDPLRLAIAVVPLAAYFLMLGAINLRRRPMVVTGAGDLATLGVALTGLALVGPISLFRPESATAQFGDLIWLFLLAFYWLLLALVTMLCRPRLVVYNLPPRELRPVLAEMIGQLDPAARWAGNNLMLPTLGVQLHLDAVVWMNNTSLVSSGPEQDLAGWRKLSRALSRSLRGFETSPSPHAGALLGIGVMLLGAAVARLAADPVAVAIAWRQITAF